MTSQTNVEACRASKRVRVLDMSNTTRSECVLFELVRVHLQRFLGLLLSLVSSLDGLLLPGLLPQLGGDLGSHGVRVEVVEVRVLPSPRHVST